MISESAVMAVNIKVNPDYRKLVPRPTKEVKLLKCSSCGSDKNVINHHLSYSPEITVPLCKSCHAYAHHSEEPAQKYSWDKIFPWGVKKQDWNVLFMRNELVATRGIYDKLHCVLCAKEGKTVTLDNERDYAKHYLEVHTQRIKTKSMESSGW